MAPTGDEAALQQYLDKDLPKMMEEYDKLWEIPDDDDDPYKSKYAARKILEGALKTLKDKLEEAPTEGEVAWRGQEAYARFLLYLGKNYYYCEEVPTAEQFFNRALKRYLASPERLHPQCFISTQDCFNQLGMLWCQRQGHSQGMNYLRRAQIMFEKRPDSIRSDKVQNQRAADNYTLTMFYLAQAYAALNKPGLSARFCAETMSQQLDTNVSKDRSKEVKEKDPFDCKDWVRNCLSLSDFFVNEAMFWTAEYLLHSANVMCERSKEICGIEPTNLEELKAECARDTGNYYSTRLKFLKTCAQYPGHGEVVWRGERKPPPAEKEKSEGSKLSFRCAADSAKGKHEAVPDDIETEIAWDDIFPEVVHLEDEEADDNKLAEETIDKVSEDSEMEGDGGKKRAVGWLEYALNEKVRLPVHFSCLHHYVERRIKRANQGFILERPRPIAKDLVIEEIGEDGNPLPPPPPPPSCAGLSFEAAREIFKLANHYQLKALEYYVLDGFVTDHVRILQEISQMYRTILWWELDHKRAGAIMKRRTRMLSPLLDVLNPKVYIAFWRQLSFEVAEVMQQHYELRAHGKLPEAHAPIEAEEEADVHQPKVAAQLNDIAQKSLKYFTTFIESYHERGVIPAKIDDDNARVYLTARLNRARLRTKMVGLPKDTVIELHKEALNEYEWIVDYGARNPDIITHPEIHFGKELELCMEMAAMLPTKLSRLAASRR